MKAAFVLSAAALALSADEPKLGIVQHGNSFELSVIYTEPVDRTSMLKLDNYRIAPGSIAAIRETATNRGVILTATGLQSNISGFLSITGLVNTTQGGVAPSILQFNTGENFWTAIGGEEIPSPIAPDATAVGTNGFDLLSAGIQQWNDYDEATFAGKRIQGDFDYKTRVEWVDPAGPNAKAGIMVREEMDANKPRPVNPDDPAQTFSRYFELFVTAPTTATGAPSAPGHQMIFRAAKGDLFTDTIVLTNNASPTFPDAWLRIEKAGPQFHLYRGTNGLTWEKLGTYQFPDPATNAWNVGVAFSPQNDDLPTNLKKAYLAKFRNISFASSLFIDIARVTNRVEISWKTPGILQQAPTVLGDWQDSPNQANPQVFDIQGSGMRFFRLRGSN